jgi:hypothetical protein
MNDNEREKSPALNIKKAAVCLHFVETSSSYGQSQLPKYPNDPVFRSMELDMLSYRFQTETNRPFGSQCEKERLPIEIVFPGQFKYYSEGREMTLVCPQPQRDAWLAVSSTRFLQSGIRVWHVVITPRKGHTFSEFDIIKLIHLYDGRAENTTLKEDVSFHVDGRKVMASGLLPTVCAGASKCAKLTAGSIEIIPPESIPHDLLLGTVRNARKPDGSEDYKRLKQWMDGGTETEAGQVLKAYCGIVTGIFDFNNMSEDELLDTLEPTLSESSGFLLINRCTLTCITKEGRAMEELGATVGISPYLIIPHAVLLHNEALVDAADSVLPTDAGTVEKGCVARLREYLCPRRPWLTDLQKAYRAADHKLKHLYLPNVFNYVTERSLYEKGGHGRGSDDKQSATLAKLGELHNRIEVRSNNQRKHGQQFIALLLSPVTASGLKNALSACCNCVLWPGWDWGIAIFVTVVLVTVMFLFDLTGAKG